MNDLMKAAVAGTDTSWAATAPLVLFVLVFLGVVVWAWSRPDVAPPLE